MTILPVKSTKRSHPHSAAGESDGLRHRVMILPFRVRIRLLQREGTASVGGGSLIVLCRGHGISERAALAVGGDRADCPEEDLEVESPRPRSRYSASSRSFAGRISSR